MCVHAGVANMNGISACEKEIKSHYEYKDGCTDDIDVASQTCLWHTAGLGCRGIYGALS